jgi:hypothetical protein
VRWLVAGLGLAVVAVLRSAIEAEVDALLRKLPEWLVHAATLVLPRRVRARYRDEMLADLDTEPGRPLWRLATAVRAAVSIGQLCWAVRRPTSQPIASTREHTTDGARIAMLRSIDHQLTALIWLAVPLVLACVSLVAATGLLFARVVGVVGTVVSVWSLMAELLPARRRCRSAMERERQSNAS